MTEEIVKLTIHNFSEYIRIAEKRMPKPFVKGSKKKLPKKYQTEDYVWDKRGYLVYKNTGSIVPSNGLTVGKPRDWRMNGQDVYNQKIKHSARNAITIKMHNKFKPHLGKIEKLDGAYFPLTLRINFYVMDQGKFNIDNDNRWIYDKVVQDTLVELGKIPDDNPKIINGNYKKTYFVEKEEEVKVEIILMKDD
jgi:hypothetical protein